MHRAAAATVLATDADARHKELFQSALVRPAIEGLSSRAKALPLGLHTVDASLPEGGLPRGAVVELAAPQGLARSTTLALSLCASAQAEARLRGESDTRGAWCAWLDPTQTLFAPALARAGVDPDRLLVVRPDLDDLARVAVRVAGCHAFSVVVVDTAGVPGCRGETRLDRWVTIVRRLALAVEGSDTTVLLLTDAAASRAMPLPAAMRIELERLGEDRLGLRVAKDRRGRVTGAQSIELGKSA
ncbi:ImuA family protein [Polyangium fumosum]|uniref:Recombinase A n=1 Tax=Polyangium fumosum TaxID=889272 RepID=A0A4V5PLL5_9BACT|nr:recombinase A [Polyangium fumosum]TKC99776.1 recombinase A [Polyangium fumosum]